MRASLVIVLGAQFVASRADHEREIQDYPLADLLQMQSLAVTQPESGAAACLVLCQKEQAELYARFLLHGVPLESSLTPDASFDPTFLSIIFADMLAGRITDRQGLVDCLSWTFLARRVQSSPAYYGEPSPQDDHLARLADRLVATLEARCAVLATGKTDFAPSRLATLYSERGVGLDDVQRIQETSLDRLVALSKSAKLAPHPNGDAANGADDASPLASFHQRLPRAVKDAIRESDPTVELMDTDEYERRILLGAWAAGRVPRGAGGLEERQRELVKRLLDAKA